MLIEAKTYRFMGHSRGDPGQYRSQQDLVKWQARDPIPQYRKYLQDHGIDEQTIESIEESVEQAITEAVEYALNAPDPHPSEVYSHVYAPSRK
jgi:TPP-dependent pyruvate/acetoin dehydrogenase alpha subunit